ncbi:MAG: FtsX-like permease family protein [Dehalococcoidia bacterium]
MVGQPTAERLRVPPRRASTSTLSGSSTPEPVRVTVAGVVAPSDPAAEYWAGRPDLFDYPSTPWPTYLFFTDEATLVEVLGAYLPTMDATYHTTAFVDVSRINARNAARLQANLEAMTAAFRQDVERTTVETRLTETIANFRQKLFFTRLPLFALMIQVVGIVLYYLVMVATMLVERQAGEIALLKSRGAGAGQIMTVYAVEGGILALLGVALGPPLALAVTALLGPTPPFRELSEGRLLAVHLSGQAVGLALLGALMALAALLWPAYRATRATIVNYKQSLGRPPRQPAFLRYYLDLFLIAVGAFLFYELRQRGSLVTNRLFGELSADPLLLLSPALFMLMIALLFLRLFPLGLRLITWLTAGMAGAAVPLALRRMVRSPVHYTRLILLLILTPPWACSPPASARRLTARTRIALPTRRGPICGSMAFASRRRCRPRRCSARSRRPPEPKAPPLPGGWPGGSYASGQFRSADAPSWACGRRSSSAPPSGAWTSPARRCARRSPRCAPTAPRRPPAELHRAGAGRIGVWAWTQMPANAFTLALRVEDGAGTAWDYRLVGPESSLYRPGEYLVYQADLTRPGFARTPDSAGPGAGCDGAAALGVGTAERRTGRGGAGERHARRRAGRGGRRPAHRVVAHRLRPPDDGGAVRGAGPLRGDDRPVRPAAGHGEVTRTRRRCGVGPPRHGSPSCAVAARPPCTVSEHGMTTRRPGGAGERHLR